MATTITHKVRNPIYDKDHYPPLEEKRWLDIWSASVSSDGYTITPSDNWSISGDRITKIPVTKIENDGNIHNVTINTSITPNTLAKIDSDGNLVAGPTIKSNGENIKLLNEKGQWTKITGNSPIIFTISADSTDSTVSIISINHDTAQSHSIKLKLNNEEYNSNILTSNEYGHVATASDINIPIATKDNAGLAPKIDNNDANKMLQVSGNTVAWVDPTTTISPVSASANGLAPKYGDNANGKILSVNNNNAPIWVDPTTTIPTVTINKNGLAPGFSANDTGKVLIVSNNGNSTSWTQLDIKDVPKYFYLVYNAWDINHEGLSPDNVYNTNQNGGGCLSFIFTENEPPTASASDEESYYSEMYLSDTILTYL